MIEFWAEAHQPAEGMSEAEADEIWNWMQTRPKLPLTHRKNGHG